MNSCDFFLLRHIPDHVRPSLISYAESGYSAYQLNSWYEAVLQAGLGTTGFSQSNFTSSASVAEQQNAGEGSARASVTGVCGTTGSAVPEMQDLLQSPIGRINVYDDDDEPSTSALTVLKRFFCHRCGHEFAKSKELIRHVNESCEQTRIWTCPEPGCGDRFNRAQRFRNHHKSLHKCCVQSSAPDCPHEDRALQFLPARYALGCGFCKACFIQDQPGFLRHLVQHCEHGHKRRAWRVTHRLMGLLERPDVRPVWLSISVQGHSSISLDWDKVEVRSFIEMLEGDVSTEKLQVQLPRLLALGRHGQTQQHCRTPSIRISSLSDIDVDTRDKPFSQEDRSVWERTGSVSDDLLFGRQPQRAFSESLHASQGLADDSGTRNEGSELSHRVRYAKASNMLPVGGAESIDPTVSFNTENATTPSIMGIDLHQSFSWTDPFAHLGSSFASPQTPVFAESEHIAENQGVSEIPAARLETANGRSPAATSQITWQRTPPGLPTVGASSPSAHEGDAFLTSTDLHDPPYFPIVGAERAHKRRKTLPASMQETLDSIPSSSRHPEGPPFDCSSC